MSFPKYQDTKESGISWVGKIPMHWDCTRLKNMFQLMKRTPEPDDEIVTAFRDGEVTLRLNRRKDGYTNAIQEHGYQRVLPNDLVIHAMDAFAGAIGVSDSTGKSTPVYSVCQQRDLDTDVHYYGRLLRHMSLSGFINSLAKGIRERSTEFRWKESANVVVPVPPPNEQTAIASFLDTETSKIDALVAEQRRLIALLKEKRQAVISHAVTKGLNPDVRMKPSGIEWLGDVPEHWKIGKCGYYVSILSGYAFPSSGFSDDKNNIRLLRGINVGVSTIRWDETVYWQRQVGDELDRFELLANDLVIGMDRPWISSGVRVAKIGERDLPCLLLQRVAAITPDNRLHTDFLLHLLSSEMFVAYFEPETTGVSVPHISPSQIEDFAIPVPPIGEQNEILDFVATETTRMETLLQEAERAIELLQERRTALISAAVTGKIDVREFACQETA